MRPLKLTMQAFGSYPDKIEIPFGKLGANNIFLIAGVTGSGKTTIFDAISFALFGESSTTTRGNETFKSHFVDDSVISFVEFEFLFNGEIYKIERYPSYYKKKPRAGGYVLESSKAQIFLPDSKIIKGTAEVNEYIEELLGIDSSQFSQIALLAQGEFLKLLNAPTKVRSEIFRTIFKTQNFQAFQNKLKDLSNEMKNEYDKLKDSLLQYISQIESNNEEILSIKESFLENKVFANLPEFLEKISDELKIDNEKLITCQNELKNLNLIFSQKNKIFERVKIKLNLINDKKILEDDFKIIENEFKIAESGYKTIKNKNDNLNDLQVELAKMKDDYEKIIEINKLKIDIKNTDDEIKLLKTNIEKIINNCVFYFKNQISSLQKDIQNSQLDFENFQNETKELSLEFEQKYYASLSNWAGVLASDLKEKQPCPVCGSINHPKKAQIANEALSSSDLDVLKKEVDNKKNLLNEKAQKCSILLKDLEYVNEKMNEFCKNNNISEVENIIVENIKIPENIFDEFEAIKLHLQDKNEECLKIKSKLELLSKEIKIDLDEFLKLHKQKTDEYNMLSVEIKEIEKLYNDKSIKKEQIISQIELLNKQILEFEDCNLDEIENLTTQMQNINFEIEKNNKLYEELNLKYTLNKKLFASIKEQNKNFESVLQKYSHYKILSDCATGNSTGKIRIAFEQYIQGYYLDMVLYEANKRLKIMTKNQFQLQRKKEITNMQGKFALDIEVMDFHTFKTRSTKTLSGGESFKAALALALGLSDCICAISGGINIDMLFIDEGFGTLDSESLELALDVILSLVENNKFVGIISHVEDLKAKIQNQIISIKTDNGSKIKMTF